MSASSLILRVRRNAARGGLVAGVLAAVVVIAGAALAAIPDSSSGVISSCLGPTGNVRVIDAQAGQACTSPERPLAWNVKGPAGPAGPPGPAGGSDPIAALHPTDLVEPFGVVTSDSQVFSLVHTETFDVTTAGFVTTYLHGIDTVDSDATCASTSFGAGQSQLYVAIDSPNPLPSDGSIQPGIFMSVFNPGESRTWNFTYPAEYLTAGTHSLQFFYAAQGCDQSTTGNVTFHDLRIGLVHSSD